MQCPPTSPGWNGGSSIWSKPLQHVPGIDAHLVEEHRQFVHESDIEIALCVLNHLCRFRYADRRGKMNAGRDNGSIERVERFGCFRAGTRNNFGDVRKPSLGIAGIYALWRVTNGKIPVEEQPRFLLEDGNSDLFGCPWIHG